MLKTITVSLLCFLMVYTASGQGKRKFPYQDFSYVKVYLVDTLRYEEIRGEMYSPLQPEELASIEKQEISKYFAYFKTIEDRSTIDKLLSVVNNTQNYYIGDCSTVFIIGGLLFYNANNSLVAVIEISPTCHEVFFKPENRAARGQLNKKGKEKWSELLLELEIYTSHEAATKAKK